MQLPPHLQAALEARLEGISARDLALAVRDLSHRYRDRSGAPVLQSEIDVLAYAVYRLPATFAAVGAVLEQVRDRLPDLRPASLLDVGAGPGTSAWAALEIWPDLADMTLLEHHPNMVRLGQGLAADADRAALHDAVWRRVDVAGPWEAAPADLVAAGYLLGELPEERRAELVRRLWEHIAGVLLLVEPGTPEGARRVRAAGDELARAGAHIIAPFPQEWSCLETESDWVHFAQRVPRTRLHRRAKDAALSYEDEKYAYVAAARRPGLPIAARVIRQPQIRSGHVRLVLCTARGVQHRVVTRSRREAFRRARSLRWGSAIPLEDAALFDLT